MTRACRSATESAPPDTPATTVSPATTIAWRVIACAARSSRLPALEPDPDLAILEVLFLPHGDGALEGVDGVAAGVEGIAAMRRRDGDEDGRLADVQAARAMQDGHTADTGPPGTQRLTDLAHLDLGHRRVRLVLEKFHGPAVRLVAHHSGEDHEATRPRVIDDRGNSVRRQRHVGHPVHVVRGTAADRGEKTELVVRGERMLGLNVVVTHGEQRIRAVPGQLRVTIDDRRPRRLDGTALGKIDVQPLLPGSFTIAGEEPHPDAHSLEAVGLAAAAAGLHVRVLDREPRAHHLVLDEIDLAAAEIRRAVFVDVHLDAVRLDDTVVIGRLLFPTKLVGHARASATHHADAQAPLGLALLEAEIGYLLGGHFAHRNHSILP